MKHLLLSKLSACVAAAFIIIVMGSCDNRKLRVDGTISEAKYNVLYFEKMRID